MSPLFAALLAALAVLLWPHHPDAVDTEPGPDRGQGASVPWAGAVPLVEGPAPAPTDVADALVLLALTYRSGLPTWQVLGVVAAVVAEPRVAHDLRQVAAALRWGASDREAWASVGPAWARAGHAVAVAHAAGTAPGPALLAAADGIRAEDQERIELAAARVGVRLVAPLGIVLLPAFCLTSVVPLVVALGRAVLAG